MLGIWDVPSLMSAMPSDLVTDWMMYFRVEPPNDYKDDMRHAIIAYLIARTMGGVKDKDVKDYIPKWEQEQKKPQTVEEAVQVAIRTTLLLGGTVN